MQRGVDRSREMLEKLQTRPRSKVVAGTIATLALLMASVFLATLIVNPNHAEKDGGSLRTGRKGRYGDTRETSRGGKRGMANYWFNSGSRTAVDSQESPVYMTADVYQPPLSSFPAVDDSTVLFLHIFKCAGTTIRDVFTGWAEKVGGEGSVVVECGRGHFQPGKVCLNTRNQLIATREQMDYVKTQKVLVGHFFWGFQEYTTKPNLMVTTLRNPLELFVSGQQFKHRQETSTIEMARLWVTASMEGRLEVYDEKHVCDVGFLRRLVDLRVTGEISPDLSPSRLSVWANNAVEHLQSFWLVGVVEQYAGLLEVLRRLLDPQDDFPQLWEESHAKKENSSPVSSRSVLEVLDPDLVSDFNSSFLGLQWQVYDVALQLWDTRCREVLPVEEQARFCDVAPPTATYRL